MFVFPLFQVSDLFFFLFFYKFIYCNQESFFCYKGAWKIALNLSFSRVCRCLMLISTLTIEYDSFVRFFNITNANVQMNSNSERTIKTSCNLLLARYDGWFVELIPTNSSIYKVKSWSNKIYLISNIYYVSDNRTEEN